MSHPLPSLPMAHDPSDSLHASPTAAQSQAAQLAAFTALGSMLGLPGMGGALGLQGMGGLPQLPGVGVGLSPMHPHDYAAHSPYGHVDVMSPARGYMQHQPVMSGGSGGGGGHGVGRPKKAATPRRNAAGDAAELGEDGQPKKKKRAPRKSDALGPDGAPAPKKRKSKAPELDANGVPIPAPPRVRKKKAAAAAAAAEGDDAGGPEAPGSGGKKRGPKRNVGVGLPYAAAGAFNAGPLAGASYPAMGAALPGEGIGMGAGGGWDLSALHPGGRGAMAAAAPPVVQIGRVAGPFHPDIMQLMYACGDVRTPLPETASVLEELLLEYTATLAERMQAVPRINISRDATQAAETYSNSRDGSGVAATAVAVAGSGPVLRMDGLLHALRDHPAHYQRAKEVWKAAIQQHDIDVQAKKAAAKANK